MYFSKLAALIFFSFSFFLSPQLSIIYKQNKKLWLLPKCGGYLHVLCVSNLHVTRHFKNVCGARKKNQSKTD